MDFQYGPPAAFRANRGEARGENRRREVEFVTAPPAPVDQPDGFASLSDTPYERVPTPAPVPEERGYGFGV